MRFLNVAFTFTTVIRYFCKELKEPVMKYLNVAEKNDAAKNIAAFLSRGSATRREGFSTFNKIYEFNATVLGQPSQMVMTSVSGHLLNYEFAAAFKNWHSCNPVALFDAPIYKACPENYVNIKRTLEREIRSCNGLIIWTDCDREGENIGFEVIKVCKDVKPNIRIYRAKFSEITAASVFRALNNLGQPNENVSNAVDVRQELDLRTGAAFTRLQTLRLQRVFPQKLADKLISYGSCQFPTLGFVVERYKAIEEFVPEPFWRIKMNHKVDELTVDYNWKRDRLFDKNACQVFLDICQENPLATVENVESKPKNKWRPLPLDTVEFEKNVSKKLKINAKEAMKIAEKLYTQGFISYPRTETNIFPKELNLVPLVQQQFEDNRWGGFAQRIMSEGGPSPRCGRKSDQAHPPIHPTKYTNNLTGNDQRIYEYIVRHFLACVSKDALGHETTVHVDISKEKFIAKGLMILERNYLEVYIYEKWNAKEIHMYQVGDTFVPTELSLVESSTSPPKLLTEADLIALMEKHGIGTDATHAEHIDTIKSREYVGLHENIYFVPGTLGMGLVEGYNNIGLQVSLAKPNLRAEFENDLKLICEGRKDPDVVRREQIEKYKAVFRTVVEKLLEIDQTLARRLEDQPIEINDPELGNQEEYKPVMKCPKCNSDMVIKIRKNGQGKFICCVGYPACKNAVWLPLSIENIEVLEENCRLCREGVKKVKIKFKHNLFPGDPNPNVLCLGGCDLNVLETLGILPSSVRPVPNEPTLTDPNPPVPNNRTTIQANNSRINQSSVGHNSTFNRNNMGRDSGYNSSNVTAGNRSTSLQNRPANNLHKNNSFISTPSTTTNNRSLNQNRLNAQDDQSSSQSNRRNNSSLNNTRTDFLNLMPKPSTSNTTNTWNNRSFINPNFSSDKNGDAGGDIVCYCNNEALLLTVRKEGPNTGRKFYKCKVGSDNGGCNFFLWADEENNLNNSQLPKRTTAFPRCNCNLQASLRTVSKEGPNKGRQFYSCSKPMGQGCNFFKWADEPNDTRPGGGGGGDDDDDDDHGGWDGGGGGMLNNSSTFSSTSNWKKNNWKGKAKGKKRSTIKSEPYTNTRKKRKCGTCGQEGHTRNKCPNV